MDYEETLHVLHTLREQHPDTSLHLSGKDLVLQGTSFLYRLCPSPLLPLPEEDWLSDYLLRVPEEPPPYLILLIEAGHAALGYFEHGEPVLHKVISTYMVRQKQGKSQLKHLNQKGKSRLGSRIRLRNTISFFEQINTKLNEWGETEHLRYIFYYSSIPHWNLLHEAKVPCPFSKSDVRLRSLSVPLYTPNFEELLRVNALLLTSSLQKEVK